MILKRFQRKTRRFIQRRVFNKLALFSPWINMNEASVCINLLFGCSHRTYKLNKYWWRFVSPKRIRWQPGRFWWRNQLFFIFLVTRLFQPPVFRLTWASNLSWSFLINDWATRFLTNIYLLFRLHKQHPTGQL